MAGGWRYGAGRPAFRPCETGYLSVDVRGLARDGLLTRPGWCSLTWSRDGLQVGAVGLHIDAGQSVRFDFTQTRSGQSRRVSTVVWLDMQPCHFGGSRWWWRCPNCSRRCARLFLVTGGMGCRACLRMAYASQREDAVGRSWRRTQKVERALGIDGSPGRQMHKKTRERLYDALEREECLRDGMLADGLARLFANAGVPVPNDW
jgi:hypothetical protein